MPLNLDLQLYKSVIRKLSTEYSVSIEQEYETVTEFFESGIPLFKLIAGHDDKKTIVIVSFHLEIDPAMAVQWFTRIRGVLPSIQITSCYLRDQKGDTFVGQEAYLLRAHLMEEEVIKNLEQQGILQISEESQKEAPPEVPEDDDAFLDEVLVKPEKPKQNTKNYTNKEQAFWDFKKLSKTKTDTEH